MAGEQDLANRRKSFASSPLQELLKKTVWFGTGCALPFIRKPETAL